MKTKIAETKTYIATRVLSDIFMYVYILSFDFVCM